LARPPCTRLPLPATIPHCPQSRTSVRPAAVVAARHRAGNPTANIEGRNREAHRLAGASMDGTPRPGPYTDVPRIQCVFPHPSIGRTGALLQDRGATARAMPAMGVVVASSPFPTGASGAQSQRRVEDPTDRAQERLVNELRLGRATYDLTAPSRPGAALAAPRGCDAVDGFAGRGGLRRGDDAARRIRLKARSRIARGTLRRTRRR
jgi:hypothetical protein